MLKVNSIILFCLILIILLPAAAECHANPDSSSPKVGSTIKKAPKNIKIWFDDYLYASSSKIWVKDAEGAEVDKKNSYIDKSDPALLEVGLKDLKPGKYHVYWSVKDEDGHKTEGDYFFTYNKE